ncbi:hypothetical protein Q9189_006503 [Teloschistes chrysophthalmus]
MPAPNHRQQPFPAAFPPGFQQQQGAGPSYSVAVPRQHPFYGQLALDPSLYDTPNHHQQPFPRFHQQQEPPQIPLPAAATTAQQFDAGDAGADDQPVETRLAAAPNDDEEALQTADFNTLLSPGSPN